MNTSDFLLILTALQTASLVVVLFAMIENSVRMAEATRHLKDISNGLRSTSAAAWELANIDSVARAAGCRAERGATCHCTGSRIPDCDVSGMEEAA